MAKKTFKEFVKEHKKEFAAGCAVIGAGVIGALSYKYALERYQIKQISDYVTAGAEGFIAMTPEQITNVFGEEHHFVDRVGTTVEVTGALLCCREVET